MPAGGAHISWGGGPGGRCTPVTISPWQQEELTSLGSGAWGAGCTPVARRAEQVMTGPPALCKLVDIFAGKNESVLLCGLNIKNE